MRKCAFDSFQLLLLVVLGNMQDPLTVMSSINNNPSVKKNHPMELDSSFDSISATNLDTKSGGGWIAGMTVMHNDQEDVVSDHNGSILSRNQCLNFHHNDTHSSPSITTQTSTIEVVILGPNQPHPYAEPNRGDYKNHTHHWEVDDTVEPITICIGYIFASKKMNTMSVVMAEASKVRLGLLCTTTLTNLCTTSATTSPALSSCSARDRCHKGDNTTITSEIHNEIMHALDNDTSKYDNHNQFTLTQARLLTHEGESGATLIRNFHPDHHSQSYKNINQKHHTYGTSKNKKSSYNGSSTSTSSSQQQQPSLSPSSQSSATTIHSTKTYQILPNDSVSAKTKSAATIMNCIARDRMSHSVKLNDPAKVSKIDTIDTKKTDTSTKPVKNVVVPLRISFVPLDDSIPFIEQHSGKIDIILHKLTEDIVNASQHMQQMIFQQVQRHVNESRSEGDDEEQKSSSAVTAIDSEACNKYQQQDSSLSSYSVHSSSDVQQQLVSMERIQRLLDYNNEHQHPPPSDEYENCVNNIISTSSPYDHVSCLIDHPMAVRKVMCRAEIATTLQQCLQNVQTKSGIPVRTPKYAILRQEPKQMSDTNIQQNGATGPLHHLSFPIIVKPLVAAGSKSSHAMTIVMANNDCGNHSDHVRCTASNTKPDETLDSTASMDNAVETKMDDLHELSSILRDKYPCLCQEYSNHDAKLYKVYVLGEYISVHQRRSLPNLPTTRSKSISDVPTSNGDLTKSVQNILTPSLYTSVEFDSQRPYPHLSDFGYSSSDEDDSTMASTNNSTGDNDECNIQVTVDEVRPIVKALKQAFHLDLFGFDILITDVPQRVPTLNTANSANRAEVIPTNHRNRNKMMLVVDVNYFPSYKELTNFPSLLAQYLAQRAMLRRRQ